jgi:transcriptional regulator with XRE-family HTH domain
MLEAEHDLTDGVPVGRAGIRGFSPAALRRYRGLKHYSLSEVSTLSGISATTINAWETGKSRPSPRTLAAVAKALGVQIADLAPVEERDLRMADLRFQAGLNQEDLADAAGIPVGVLGAIELGHREPDDEQLRSIASALNVDVDFLRAAWARTRHARISRLKSR